MNGFLTKLSDRRGVAIAAVCLAFAGCTADGHGTSADLESSVQPQPAKMMALASDTHATVPSSRPPVAALPSDLGAVRSVRTHDYVDGVRQDIALDGSAVRSVANGMTVLVRTTRQQTLDEHVPLDKPSEGAIRSEIGAQFPHMPMQIVERESSNSYGPYGLALGRAPNDVRCLYMWQWIDGNRLPQGTELIGPASVRVRLCRAGMTFDAMAAAVDHLVIGRDAASSAPGRVATNDHAEVIVAPDGGAAESDEQAAKVRPAKPRKHHIARHRPAPKADVASDDSGGYASDGSRYRAPGPRFAAPAVAPAPSAVPTPAPALGDLPAQAYLGPKAGSAVAPPPTSPPTWRN